MKSKCAALAAVALFTQGGHSIHISQHARFDPPVDGEYMNSYTKEKQASEYFEKQKVLAEVKSEE